MAKKETKQKVKRLSFENPQASLKDLEARVINEGLNQLSATVEDLESGWFGECFEDLEKAVKLCHQVRSLLPANPA